MTTETIYGQIVSKANNYLAVPDTESGRRITKTKRLRDYERSFADQCKIYRGMGIASPFRLYAVVWQTSNLYDLDNSIKTLLDCLQSSGVFVNDNLCIEIIARKCIDPVNPRVEFAIEEINKQLSLFDLREYYCGKSGHDITTKKQ